MVAKKAAGTRVEIKAPDLRVISFKIRGQSEYVQSRFTKKAQDAMAETMEAGSTANAKRKVRKPRDFDADYESAKHISTEGWLGIPATAFRNALISACRLVSFTMTLAKLSVFVIADGRDVNDGTPLIRIYGDEEQFLTPARNANGSFDIRARPRWMEWTATVNIRYDADQFTRNDLANLLQRVGLQVGVGEGRWDSYKSGGLGRGCFEFDKEKEVASAQSD